MDLIEIYSEIEKGLGSLSTSTIDIVDNGLKDQLEGEQTVLFESVSNYSDCHKKMKKHINFISERIDILGYILGSDMFDISKANDITIRTNRHTKDVQEIRDFIESSLKDVLQKFERMILKEYINEYSSKIDLIYNLFYNYRLKFKKPELNLPEKLQDSGNNQRLD